jgi:hypothetical protein
MLMLMLMLLVCFVKLTLQINLMQCCCCVRLQWNEITNHSIEFLAKALMKNIALKVIFHF